VDKLIVYIVIGDDYQGGEAVEAVFYNQDDAEAYREQMRCLRIEKHKVKERYR